MVSGGDRAHGRVFWHGSLSDSVKASFKEKLIRTSSGTIDIAVGPARIKLGTRGYCSMARADAVLAEGSFSVDNDGLVTFEWTHAIKFSESWKPLADKSGFLTTLSLLDGTYCTMVNVLYWLSSLLKNPFLLLFRLSRCCWACPI